MAPRFFYKTKSPRSLGAWGISLNSAQTESVQFCYWVARAETVCTAPSVSIIDTDGSRVNKESCTVDNKHNTVQNDDLSSGFTLIPEAVFRMGLSSKAILLYTHMLYTSRQNDGNTKEDTAQIAKACRMSARAVSTAKKELIERGLIEPGGDL